MKKRNRWSPKLLRDQLILWFVAVIVVLLGVLAYVTAATLRPSLYDTHVNHLQRTTTLLCSQLNSTRASLQAYSVNILADDTVQGFLTGAYDDKDPTETSNMLRTLLMRVNEENQRWPLYDRRIHNPVEGAVEIREQILILEGNWLLLDEAPWNGLNCDYSIFLRAGDENQLERIVRRKMLGGFDEATAREFVRSNDAPNIQRCMDRSRRGDLNLQYAGDGTLEEI